MLDQAGKCTKAGMSEKESAGVTAKEYYHIPRVLVIEC